MMLEVVAVPAFTDNTSGATTRGSGETRSSIRAMLLQRLASPAPRLGDHASVEHALAPRSTGAILRSSRLRLHGIGTGGGDHRRPLCRAGGGSETRSATTAAGDRNSRAHDRHIALHFEGAGSRLSAILFSNGLRTAVRGNPLSRCSLR